MRGVRFHAERYRVFMNYATQTLSQSGATECHNRVRVTRSAVSSSRRSPGSFNTFLSIGIPKRDRHNRNIFIINFRANNLFHIELKISISQTSNPMHYASEYIMHIDKDNYVHTSKKKLDFLISSGISLRLFASSK